MTNEKGPLRRRHKFDESPPLHKGGFCFGGTIPQSTSLTAPFAQGNIFMFVLTQKNFFYMR